MSYKRLEPIKALVSAALTSLGHEMCPAEVAVMCSWEKIVGRQLAARSFPLNLRDSVLTVAVYSSVWMGQLTFLRGELAKKVNGKLGQNAVSSVRLVLRTKPDWLPTRRKAPNPLPALGPEEEKVLEETCRQISDPDLKEVVRRVLTCQLSLILLRRSDRSGERQPP